LWMERLKLHIRVLNPRALAPLQLVLNMSPVELSLYQLINITSGAYFLINVAKHSCFLAILRVGVSYLQAWTANCNMTIPTLARATTGVGYWMSLVVFCKAWCHYWQICNFSITRHVACSELSTLANIFGVMLVQFLSTLSHYLRFWLTFHWVLFLFHKVNNLCSTWLSPATGNHHARHLRVSLCWHPS